MNMQIIRNVTVFDGSTLTGNQDVTIEGSVISDICPTADGNGGTNCILSPGFVDVHTHADYEIGYSDCAHFLAQGVTTVIGGNCGLHGGFPNGDLDSIINPDGFPSAWKNSGEYLDWVASRQMGVQYASLIGYHTLVEESRALHIPTEEYTEKILDAGYLGISIGYV